VAMYLSPANMSRTLYLAWFSTWLIRKGCAGSCDLSKRGISNRPSDSFLTMQRMNKKLAELDDLFGDSKIPRSMYLKQRHRLDTRIINRHEQLVCTERTVRS